MAVIVTGMVSATRRRGSSYFHGLWTELKISGFARLFQAMFLQCLWCRQLSWNLSLLFENLWGQTAALAQRISGSSVDFIINLFFRLLRLAHGFKHAKMLNAKSCLLSPSCLSKASGKYFSEAYCCHLLDAGRVFMESLLLIPWCKRSESYMMIIGWMMQLWWETVQKWLQTLCCPSQWHMQVLLPCE